MNIPPRASPRYVLSESDRKKPPFDPAPFVAAFPSIGPSSNAGKKPNSVSRSHVCLSVHFGWVAGSRANQLNQRPVDLPVYKYSFKQLID